MQQSLIFQMPFDEFPKYETAPCSDQPASDLKHISIPKIAACENRIRHEFLQTSFGTKHGHKLQFENNLNETPVWLIRWSSGENICNEANLKRKDSQASV